MLYHSRKKVSKEKKISIRLDLTKRRYNVLKQANSEVKGIDFVSFVYADVNCRLKIKFTDGTESSFSTIEQLRTVLNEFSG